MLMRLPYLGITNAFALLRLPDSDRDKDAEILAFRYQLAALHRQLPQQTGPVRRSLPAMAARAAAPATQAQPARPTAAHTTRHHPALAPRPRRTPPRDGVSAPRRARPRTIRSIRAVVLRIV